MNYIDLAILIVVAVFVLIGLSRGFLHSVISLLGTLVAFLAGLFLAQVVANMLGGLFGLKDSLGEALKGLFSGELLNTPISASDPESLQAALRALGLPPFLVAPIASAVAAAIPAGMAEFTLASYIGPMVGNAILWVVSFLIIFFGIKLVALIFEKILKNLLANRTLRATDRILGGAFGAAKAILLVFCLLAVLTFLLPMESMAPIRKSLADAGIGRAMYENNFILNFLVNKLPNYFRITPL